MAQLYGRVWSKEELLKRAGRMSQLGDVRLVELQEGNARGVRVAQFQTGSGLEFEVLLDRGMDIGACKYRGASLAWESSTGPAHPAYFERGGLGWLRTFHGGLVTGCGMTSAGAPSSDAGEELGLHGRLSHTPATNVWADGAWRGDDYEMWVRGHMRETVVFGENLTLVRRIWAHLGESRLFLRDLVTNEGYITTPHMMLYHVNFGFPLLDEGTELISRSTQVTPRDEVAAPGLDAHARYEAPIQGYAEQVFYHDMVADAEGYVTVILANRGYDNGRGLGVYLKYRQAELPRFTQWKMVGAGTYVTGLEPANCRVEGRAAERQRGTLQFLEPGEQREYLLEIGVLDGNAAIDAATARLPGA
ncbi:MAG: aldose 1-epimerase family protein [Chloroflexi bacterium]|nr:aldose 1-epimerase family protein [Chloroflexota bacterium]